MDKEKDIKNDNVSSDTKEDQLTDIREKENMEPASPGEDDPASPISGEMEESLEEDQENRPKSTEPEDELKSGEREESEKEDAAQSEKPSDEPEMTNQQEVASEESEAQNTTGQKISGTIETEETDGNEIVPLEEVPEDKMISDEPADQNVTGDDGDSGKKPVPSSEEDHAEKEKSGKRELSSEHDLKEKDEEHEEEEHDEEIDYSTLDKAELVAIIKDLARSENVVKAERQAREVKSAFDDIREQNRAVALKKFIEEGSEENDFSWRPDELTLRFDANYQLIRDRKNTYVKSRENLKEVNLKKKEQLLERLREFVDSEETTISFDEFKSIQEEWKTTGPVPGTYARTLWANYNALVDRFYDNRSIYYELKELDRKKNLAAKLELCVKAEHLSEKENINEAIKELNELHHDFKHIGPVPKEDQEGLWQQFKGASDAVYDRRKEFVDKLKGELDANLKIKLDLAEQVQEYTSFDSDRIKAWNEKTKALLDIQKKWENTGGLPRARAKEVNRTFWSAFKTFFSNKNHFFKKLDAEREQNLDKKRQMVEKAHQLEKSDEWQDTARELKDLQQEWKNVGPVPGKYRESIYKEFKEACDTFFNRKRAQRGEATKEYVENYKQKMEIVNEIRQLAAADKNNLDRFKSLQEEYGETGFVPKNKISEVRTSYTEAVNSFVNALDGMSSEEKQKIKIENQVSNILHSPNSDQKLYRKEQTLRKQISTIENDIALWKNNLEFFADSKKADKLKDEFHTKIKSASEELKQLKQQLRIIRTA